MRRKRLQHAAHIACRMLCGWRLQNDQKALTGLGSGTLEIDLMTEDCLYNGGSIEPLNMAAEIGHWLRRDLEAHHIPADGITKATLQAQFDIRPLVGKRKANTFIAGDIKHPKGFITCAIKCESAIETDEKVYRSQYNCYDEWPEDWWTALSGEEKDVKRGEE